MFMYFNVHYITPYIIFYASEYKIIYVAFTVFKTHFEMSIKLHS